MNAGPVAKAAGLFCFDRQRWPLGTNGAFLRRFPARRISTKLAIWNQYELLPQNRPLARLRPNNRAFGRRAISQREGKESRPGVSLRRGDRSDVG